MDAETEIRNIIAETRRLMGFDELAGHLVRRLGEVWLGATVYAAEETGGMTLLKPVQSSVLTPQEMAAYSLPVGDNFLGGKRVFIDNVYTDGEHAVVPIQTDRKHGVLQIFGAGLQEYVPLFAALKQPIGTSMANSRQHDEAVRMAECDPLTGLYNSRTFMEELDKAMWRVKKGEEECTSAVMLEVDHFKKQNTKYGWTNVNQYILIPLSNLFIGIRPSRATSKNVMVARYGGDEFTLRADSPEHEAAGMAERYRRELAATSFRVPLNGNWDDAQITLSGGITSYSGTEYKGPEDMMSAAEEAVKYAKRRRGNRTYLNRSGRIERNPWDTRHR